MEKIRIGIIGVGGIACGVHIPQLKACEDVVITAICDIDEAKLQKVGDELNIPADHRFTDYHDLIASDVDAVEVCTPNYLHIPMAVAAVKAGKHVNVEKPLALTCEQAKELEACDFAPGQVGMMCMSYRFRPALRYAKRLIEEGILGEITGVQVSYLKDSALWKGRGMEWRFEKEKAMTGVLGDLGVHLIDMTQLLAGPIVSVCGRTRTIVTERPYPDGSIGKVETDDVCTFLAVLESGADASFTITRAAYGHGNNIKFDIHGTKGALSFDLDKQNSLWVATDTADSDEGKKLHEITVPAGYDAQQERTFLDAIHGKQGQWYPSLQDGFNSQRILDALLTSSIERRWVDIER